MKQCEHCPAKRMAELATKALDHLNARMVDLEARQRLEHGQWYEDWNDLFGRLEALEKSLG